MRAASGRRNKKYSKPKTKKKQRIKRSKKIKLHISWMENDDERTNDGVSFLLCLSAR